MAPVRADGNASNKRYVKDCSGSLTRRRIDISADYIKIRDLNVAYGGEQLAIDDIDLSVEEGEFVAIVGPSGCGKSTLLHVMSGLLRPTSGVVEIAGRSTSGNPDEVPRIGYVFQDHRLLPWRTVAQNIRLVLAAADVSRDEWDDRINYFLEMLHISQFRDQWPLNMSGGQRQRVSIARALAIEPAVVLMDEPFSTLDEVTARAMRTEILGVWEESRRTIVFVTHSIREALYLADRVVILTKGPARLLDELSVPLTRPREFEDPKLTELEAKVVSQVMPIWGYGTKASDRYETW